MIWWYRYLLGQIAELTALSFLNRKKLDNKTKEAYQYKAFLIAYDDKFFLKNDQINLHLRSYFPLQ